MKISNLSSNMDSSDASSDDIIKLMVATDIHLGYLENDPVRGEDSFIAFEEVLAAAVECDVDLVLLGGDLFHHAKPSPNSMLRCTEIIRQYCFGDKPIAIELLSDRDELFKRPVNYEDPNLNISYPIMSIHGNHDDPVGQGAVSSLDILASMGLVNYFGKWTDYTHVKMVPILMRKGCTNLALYGLSHLKDQRLCRLFAETKVEMERPDDKDDWFNLLVLHQNRADRGPGNYIKEEVLPDFLDLVVWGHEHDCRVQEEENHVRRFFVTQPGSTVATSLACGEAIPKHCAFVQVHKKKFNLTPIPLKTVRPFIFKTIVLSEEDLGEVTVNENEKVQDFLKLKVNESIEEANKLRSGHPKQPEMPLIRLSVFYERDSQDFNRVRFGQNFSGSVANANDILVMKREKRIREKTDENGIKDEEVDLPKVIEQCADVESLIRAYFAALPIDKGLSVLSVHAMTDAVRDFTIKNDDDIFRSCLDAHRRRCLALLADSNAEDESEIVERLKDAKIGLDQTEAALVRSLIDEDAAKYVPVKEPLAQGQRVGAAAAVAQLAKQKRPVVVLTPSPVAARATPAKRQVVVLSSDDEEPLQTTRGRGRGARGARGGGGGGGGRARGRTRGAARQPSPPPTPERRSTPRRTAAKRGASWLQNVINDKTQTIDDSD